MCKRFAYRIFKLTLLSLLGLLAACTPVEFRNVESTATPNSSAVSPTTVPLSTTTVSAIPTLSPVETMPATETFTPIMGDMAYVRQGSLWVRNSTTGEERLVVPNPHATQAYNPIAAPPVWHNKGQWLAYLAYYPQDLVARQVTDRGYLNFVDLDKGIVWHRSDLQVALQGAITWDTDLAVVYVVGNATHPPVPQPLPDGHIHYPFEGYSGIFSVAVPDGQPKVLLSESIADDAYVGPVQFSAPAALRYVRVSGNGLINIDQLDLASMITKTLANSRVDAVKVPFGIPTLYLPDQGRLFYLISAPIPGLEEWHGLYSVSPATGDEHRISTLDYGCGLEAGIWEDKIALGCGGAESIYLVLCDIGTEECENVMSTLRDDLLSLIVPEGQVVNSLKIRPVAWLDNGDLYIIAVAYAAGETWSGQGHLLRFDRLAGDFELLLSDVDFVSFVPHFNRALVSSRK